VNGLRVLDLSRIIAGPYAAMLLGDLGADVVKVERPGRGDDMRYWHQQDGMSLGFATINLASARSRGPAARGLKIIHELARRADVISRTSSPGRRALGLGYSAPRD
jgi:crotonobetainyl-CoA:carnitine CoA-transferase CaiB-like acyl-CoA transferase